MDNDDDDFSPTDIETIKRFSIWLFCSVIAFAILTPFVIALTAALKLIALAK